MSPCALRPQPRSDRFFHRPARDPLVRIDVPDRIPAVSGARQVACTRSLARHEIAGRRRSAVLWNDRYDRRRPPRPRVVLRAAVVLPCESARHLRGVEGRYGFARRIIGVIVAMALFARARRKSFLRVADFVVPLVPLGLGAGRIGNFINGELWGRAAMHRYRGRSCFRKPATRWRDIRRRFISSC